MTRILQRFRQRPAEACKCRGHLYNGLDNALPISVNAEMTHNLFYNSLESTLPKSVNAEMTRIPQRFGQRPAQAVRAEMTGILKKP